MSARPGDASEFNVMVTIEASGTVVAVCGEVDVATAPRLREALTQAQARRLRDVADRPLVVDLSRVTFIDARGLGVLAGAARRAHGDGRDIVLRDPNPGTFQVLQITRLLGVFRVEWRDGTAAVLDVSSTGSTRARRSPIRPRGVQRRSRIGTPCGRTGRRSRSRGRRRSRH